MHIYILVFCSYIAIAMIMSFKNNINLYFHKKKRNKNKDNLVINIDFNHKYIIIVK
jgi:hypothetical protein